MIENKDSMYEALLSGRFGNFSPHFSDIQSWLNFFVQNNARYDLNFWMIRSALAGDPKMKIDVPTEDVIHELTNFGEKFYVTPMLNHMTVFRAEIWEPDISPFGLWVRGTTDRNLSLGKALDRNSKVWTGTAAKMVLEYYLNDNSREDLKILLEQYPQHVVEVSVLEKEYGSLPGRNTIVWEVRSTTGAYECW